MFFVTVMFFSCFSFIFVYGSHYMLLLLLLEGLLLSLFLSLSFSFLMSLGLEGLLFFLLLMVCMGGFSVSLLVCLSRFFGRDFWLNRFVF